MLEGRTRNRKKLQIQAETRGCVLGGCHTRHWAATTGEQLVGQQWQKIIETLQLCFKRVGSKLEGDWKGVT